MKYIFTVFILSFTCTTSFAQPEISSVLYKLIESKLQQGISFTAVSLFDSKQQDNAYGNSVVAHYTILSPDKAMVHKTFSDKNNCIKLSLRGEGNQPFILLLSEEKINSTDDFFVSSVDSKNVIKKSTYGPGLHYRGCIQGDNTSLAAISIFDNGEIMGVFAGREGNFILGKMKDKADAYVLYKSNDMLIEPRYDCGADKLEENNTVTEQANIAIAPQPTAAPVTLCQKVKLYWEADYNLYNLNFSGNLANTQNYLSGVFNIVATLYPNEGIVVELAHILVWTSPDGYANSGSSAALSSFRGRWNGLDNAFNGDLAHLVAGGTTNYGGIAYLLSGLCGSRTYNYGYSNVYGNYQAYPNYSWDAMVLTHETGHNLGSKHTHWCGWNTGASGTCGAIDNCYTLESSGTCSTCTPTTNADAPPAGFKGTIMSYCHLRNGIGIGLTNGFGPQPRAVIRNSVSTGTCLTFLNNWTGLVDTAWENPYNWSCGSLPNANTDVVIKSRLTNYPVINSAAICRSIKQANSTSVEVNPAFTLTITGQSN